MDDDHKANSGMDWRVVFGMVVTALWMTAGLIYLLAIVGWSAFVRLPTADIGSFLEGAFAPLAFLWLVIGHFMQQKEITANTKAITMQEKSARRLELHSRRDSYFKLLTLVQDQLGVIASFHYVSVVGPTGTGAISQQEFTELRSRASSGDSSLFIRQMLNLIIDQNEDVDAVRDILFGTEIRERHADNFTTTFARLLEAARDVDTGNMVSDALLYGSAAGIYYSVICRARDNVDGDSLRNILTTQSSRRE